MNACLDTHTNQCLFYIKPQGSDLGPILFIVYINDLSDHIQSSLWTFADDTKIYRPILSDVDHTMLQNDLDYFMQWNKTWQRFLLEYPQVQVSVTRFFRQFSEWW